MNSFNPLTSPRPANAGFGPADCDDSRSVGPFKPSYAAASAAHMRTCSGAVPFG